MPICFQITKVLSLHKSLNFSQLEGGRNLHQEACFCSSLVDGVTKLISFGRSRVQFSRVRGTPWLHFWNEEVDASESSLPKESKDSFFIGLFEVST